MPNVYHFDGLIEAAKPFAEERIVEKKAAQAARKEREERLNNKKPTLTAIDGGKIS